MKPFLFLRPATSVFLSRLCVAALSLACGLAPAKDKKEKELIDPDTGLITKADELLKVKFSRTPDDVFQAVVDLAAKADADQPDEVRLPLYVKAGAWDKAGEVIAAYVPDLALRLHSRIVLELTGFGSKPLMLPSDVVGLADASAAELDDRQTYALGRLLLIALQGTDTKAELMAVLTQGTKRLGGADETRRRAAAKMLAAAELWVEAKEFGLKEAELPKQFAAAAESAEKVDNRTWEESLAALRDDSLADSERNAAIDQLYQTLVQAPPASSQARLVSLVGDLSKPQEALAVLAWLGRRATIASNEIDFKLRKVHLELQRESLKAVSAKTSLDQAPWQTLSGLYARTWQNEAVSTLRLHPAWIKATEAGREKLQHVPLEDMVACAPEGAWQKALSPQVAASVDLALIRLLMISENIDRALPQIGRFIKHDRKVAADLANNYLAVWSQRHNPNLSADVLKQFKLDSQAIVLTRLEQETSLKQLGALLAALDEPTRKLLNEEQLVVAFDVCHSKAEIYARKHVAEVFGPIKALSPTLVRTLFDRMRNKLASSWRELSVQRDAATRRSAADAFQLVNEGYTEAAGLADEWLKAHGDDWRMSCTAGSLMSDWAEYAYFQAVVSEEDTDRFATYLQRTREAIERFRAGAQAYAKQVPKLKRSEFELLPYRAWFYGLLGIARDTDVNLRKGVTKEGLEEIRHAMLDLPAGAGDVHLELFSAMVADNIQQRLIAPEMKYRYLSSAVQITGRCPTVYPAEEKVQYYDSLLKEIRLEARLDGPDRIAPQGHFGVFVSLVHTADLARESGGFDKYLMNKVRRVVSGKTISEEPFYRDRFEESLRLALGDFFEIKEIVFADPNAGARQLDPSAETTTADKTADKSAGKVAAKTPAPRGGWQETPLAYLHLVTKDATVDRIPALEIELDFFDREGKVVIPVPSHPVLLEINDKASPQRPATKIAVTQIVDSRELAEKKLKMDVVATAHGLVSDLRDLVNLESSGLKVTEIDEKEGLLVRELHSGPDGLYALSERSWTVHFDPAPLLRASGQRIDFEFPKNKRDDVEVLYRTYDDVNPVEAAAKITLLEGEAARKVAQPNYFKWFVAGLAGLAALVAITLFVIRMSAPPAAVAARPFVMPREVTPFSIVALLQRIAKSRSVTLSEQQRQQLRQDISSLERQAFAPTANAPVARDLEALAGRWLDAASATVSASTATPAPAV